MKSDSQAPFKNVDQSEEEKRGDKRKQTHGARETVRGPDLLRSDLISHVNIMAVRFY